jgi:dTMP kinase
MGYSGKFVVVEGTEGAGKTTQIKLTAQWLTTAYPDRPLIVTRQPGGTALGQGIRQMLLDPDNPIVPLTELLLYAADRAQHVEELIKPHLAQGGIVLSDRYTDSTVAYQGYGRQLDLNLIEQLNAIATTGLTSNLTLWLDVDVQQGVQRARGLKGNYSGGDRIEQESLDFHHRVRAGFQALALAHPDRIVTIDANRPPDEVQTDLRQAIAARL